MHTELLLLLSVMNGCDMCRLYCYGKKWITHLLFFQAGFGFGLFNDTWSQQGHRCHVWPHFFSTCKSPDQTSDHTLSGLSAWWLRMVILIFLRGLCRYVWVNILTLSPSRVYSGRPNSKPSSSVSIVLRWNSAEPVLLSACAWMEHKFPVHVYALYLKHNI